MTEITKRKADMTDAVIVHRIRNAKDVRMLSENQEFIPYKEHLEFFTKQYKKYEMILKNEKVVGYIRKEVNDRINIAILPEYRNEGIGKEILKQLSGNAVILLRNEVSLHCFIKAGWNLIGFYLKKDSEGKDTRRGVNLVMKYNLRNHIKKMNVHNVMKSQKSLIMMK